MTNTSKPRKKAAKNAQERKAHLVASHLQRMDDLIKSQKLAQAQAADGGETKQASLLPSWRRRAEKTERPPTPTLPEEEADAEEKELALIMLQKLIRGRAAQNMMYEGKERRGELINELRESEAMLADPEVREKEEALTTQAERGVQVLEGAMNTLQGEVVSATLDFLAKELVRKEEAAKLKRTRGDVYHQGLENVSPADRPVLVTE